MNGCDVSLGDSDTEVVEVCDGIGFGPQTDLARFLDRALESGDEGLSASYNLRDHEIH